MFLKFVMLNHTLAVALSLMVVAGVDFDDFAGSSSRHSSQARFELATGFELTLADETIGCEIEIEHFAERIGADSRVAEMWRGRIAPRSLLSWREIRSANFSQEELIALRMATELVRRFNGLMGTE